MRISDQKLQSLLNENELEFNYNDSITGRMLLSVSMYIDNEDELVDITFSRCGLFETLIFVGEDTEVELTTNQLNMIYNKFDKFFKAKERQDVDNYYEWKARQDDYLSYYIR